MHSHGTHETLQEGGKEPPPPQKKKLETQRISTGSDNHSMAAGYTLRPGYLINYIHRLPPPPIGNPVLYSHMKPCTAVSHIEAYLSAYLQQILFGKFNHRVLWGGVKEKKNCLANAGKQAISSGLTWGFFYPPAHTHKRLE